MDFVIARLDRDPTMHVYHYAPYEPTALKRLMGRHGTREDEVDRLLRGGVLVDLLRAVRQGVRAASRATRSRSSSRSTASRARSTCATRGRSIVAFEQWLELGDGERPAADHLERIEAYNRDDVVSNLPAARLARGAERRARCGSDGPSRAAPGAKRRRAV